MERKFNLEKFDMEKFDPEIQNAIQNFVECAKKLQAKLEKSEELKQITKKNLLEIQEELQKMQSH